MFLFCAVFVQGIISAEVVLEGKCDHVEYKGDAGIYRLVCVHLKF